MKYEQYIDYYLAVAIGLDNHEVVNVYGFPGSQLEGAQTVKVKTDNKQDVNSVIVEVEGLDISYNRIYENVEFIDSRVAHTKTEFIRINKATVISGVNKGSIEVGNLVIPSGLGEAMSCSYTIPRNYEGYITSVSSPNDEDMFLFTRENNITRKVLAFRGQHFFKIPYKVNSCTDIGLDSISKLDGSIQIMLLENS